MDVSGQAVENPPNLNDVYWSAALLLGKVVPDFLHFKETNYAMLGRLEEVLPCKILSFIPIFHQSQFVPLFYREWQLFFNVFLSVLYRHHALND